MYEYRYEWRIPGKFCLVGWADPQLAPQEDGPASSDDQLEFQVGSYEQFYNFCAILDMQKYNIYKTVNTWWNILLDPHTSKAKLRLTDSYCI